MAMKQESRRLETLGKSVVAAINGHAPGGGLEIALACHARFALDDAWLKIGRPRSTWACCPGVMARCACPVCWACSKPCRYAARAPTFLRRRRRFWACCIAWPGTAKA